MGPVTDVPLLERGSPETNRGPAVANPRIRVCSTVVSAAAPCHARSSGGHLASERIGDEHPCLQLLNRDMRVVHPLNWTLAILGLGGGGHRAGGGISSKPIRSIRPLATAVR